MPRKGTETLLLPILRTRRLHLEMRCPGRGRKLVTEPFGLDHKVQFGNEMPRKGTETCQVQEWQTMDVEIWK